MGTYSRRPWAAGQFYPADRNALRTTLDTLMPQAQAPLAACGVLAPHAGYVYSGKTAGKVFGAIHVPNRVIVLCPNHSGIGNKIAVMDKGEYALPGSHIPIDTQLAQTILSEFPKAQVDPSAHQNEHAIEVELPFLLARQPKLRLVPIVLGAISRDEATELGMALHAAVCRLDEDVLVVASSDMSHYLPVAQAMQQDHLALEPILNLDPAGLHRTIVDNNITMCGYLPTIAMLAYAQARSAKSPQLVDYTTSGQAFGDYDRVVGYAGVVIPS